MDRTCNATHLRQLYIISLPPGSHLIYVYFLLSSTSSIKDKSILLEEGLLHFLHDRCIQLECITMTERVGNIFQGGIQLVSVQVYVNSFVIGSALHLSSVYLEN